MKAVLICFNSKGLRKVILEFNKIYLIDTVLFSYFKYPLVIGIAKAWLNYHKEYTHVLIASGDLVVKEKNIVRMIEISKDYAVISGVSNVEYNDFRFFNVCEEIPIKNIDYREYKWIKKENRGIIKIKHSGFSLICIRRDIILKDGFWESEPQISMDLNFSWHCLKNNIDIYCDTENIMLHLRHQGDFKNLDATIKENIYVKH